MKIQDYKDGFILSFGPAMHVKLILELEPTSARSHASRWNSREKAEQVLNLINSELPIKNKEGFKNWCKRLARKKGIKK